MEDGVPATGRTLSDGWRMILTPAGAIADPAGLDGLSGFIDALKSMDHSRQDPLGRAPLLHMEMILFVARAEKRRPELAKRLRARRKLVTDIVETSLRNSGRTGLLNPAWTGAIVLALEDGFRLHRLIDPETTPADSFLRAIGELQRAMGLASETSPA